MFSCFSFRIKTAALRSPGAQNSFHLKKWLRVSVLILIVFSVSLGNWSCNPACLVNFHEFVIRAYASLFFDSLSRDIEACSHNAPAATGASWLPPSLANRWPSLWHNAPHNTRSNAEYNRWAAYLCDRTDSLGTFRHKKQRFFGNVDPFILSGTSFLQFTFLCFYTL